MLPIKMITVLLFLVNFLVWVLVCEDVAIIGGCCYSCAVLVLGGWLVVDFVITNHHS